MKRGKMNYKLKYFRMRKSINFKLKLRMFEKKIKPDRQDRKMSALGMAGGGVV